MSHIPDEMKDAMKYSIRAKVNEVFDDRLSPVEEEIEESEETVEEAECDKKSKKESYNDKDKKKKEDKDADDETGEVEEETDDDSDDEDDDEDDEDEEDEDPDRSKEVTEASFFESIDVTATKKGGGRNAEEEITVRRMSDLNKLARSGKYEYFVTKRNGRETEYHVDNGKLVKM